MSAAGTTSQGLHGSLGTSAAGRWLFKDKGLLMGPVPANVIIDKLYAGEIGTDTVVAHENDDERWSSVRDVSPFSIHVAKAEARRRVLSEKKAHEAKIRRKTATRFVVLSVSGLALVLVVFGAVAWVVTTQPWHEEDANLADLDITVNPPVISLASAADLTRGSELFLDVNVEKAPEAPPQRTRRSTRAAAVSPPPTAASAPPEAGAPVRKAVTQADADGLATTRSYDMDHIRSVLNSQSRTLFPCIREEVRRSGFSGNIPFTFVINNDGRVGRLWVDERRLRGGEMQQCFEQTMASWRFNTFQGEVPNVSHSFTIGGGG